MGPSDSEHFDRISDDYALVPPTWASVYERIGELVAPIVEGRDILDIGNGGYFPYDTSRASSVTVLDVSPAMLDRIDVPDVDKVIGDARDLAEIPDATHDVVIYLLCLHHINGAGPSDSLRMLSDVFRAAKRVLRPGGSVVIAEPVMAGAVYAAERAMFRPTRRLLAMKDVPMIFFHRRADLTATLASAMSVTEREILVEKLPIRGWVDPLGGSFPGRIKIPASLCPTRYVFLHAKKPDPRK